MRAFISHFDDGLVLFILFSFTIFIHELCHFLTARKFGLVIETFSIGFGPAIWKKKHKGITYKIGWIPFGGYVALPQLDPSGMQKIQGQEGDGAKPGANGRLPAISPWVKILVSVSGVVGNVILAVILAWVIYATPGAKTAQGDTVIGFVSEGSAAYEAGLRPGDRILEVEGEPVRSWHDFTVETVLRTSPSNAVALTVESRGDTRTVEVMTSETEDGQAFVEGILRSAKCMVKSVMPGSPAEDAGLKSGDIIISYDGEPVAGTGHFIEMVAKSGGEPAPISVEREGSEIETVVTPRFDPEEQRPLIGVRLEPTQIILPWMRYKDPWRQIKGDAGEITRILRALVTPRESKKAAGALGGPVMIITWLWLSIKMSIFNALGFLRFLNVNLAILNLLPIPVLDGGHIVLSLYEGVTRRKVHPKLVNIVVNIFATLLILVFVILTFRDVLRLPRIFGRGGQDETPAVVKTNAVEAAAAGTNAVAVEGESTNAVSD